MMTVCLGLGHQEFEVMLCCGCTTSGLDQQGVAKKDNDENDEAIQKIRTLMSKTTKERCHARYEMIRHMGQNNRINSTIYRVRAESPEAIINTNQEHYQICQTLRTNVLLYLEALPNMEQLN